MVAIKHAICDLESIDLHTYSLWFFRKIDDELKRVLFTKACQKRVQKHANNFLSKFLIDLKINLITESFLSLQNY